MKNNIDRIVLFLMDHLLKYVLDDLPVHSWTILLSPINWYWIPRACRTVRDSSKCNFMIIISILSLVCKQLAFIHYEIKTRLDIYFTSGQ